MYSVVYLPCVRVRAGGGEGVDVQLVFHSAGMFLHQIRLYVSIEHY